MLAFDRRTLLKLSLASGASALDRSRHAAAQAGPPFKSNPFTLGVASGDPSPDGFVLWTRLAPEPLHGRGGMSILPVDVIWEISEQPSFGSVLRIRNDEGSRRTRPFGACRGGGSVSRM